MDYIRNLLYQLIMGMNDDEKRRWGWNIEIYPRPTALLLLVFDIINFEFIVDS